MEEKIDLPEKGIVVGFELENLLLMTEYDPELKKNVVFRLSKFKERHEHNGETVYIAYYRFDGFVSL